MACPQRAIENIAGRFCIDSTRCNECGACIRECPTGAADTYIEVEKPLTLEEQAEMTLLPTA
jgi:Fe-S-cluster-containing hydrogenase component 2